MSNVNCVYYTLITGQSLLFFSNFLLANYPFKFFLYIYFFIEESLNSENNFLEKNQKCFISWNSRGIKNKKEDLEILTKELNPFCICNQETKLKINQSFSLKNYIFEHKPQILHQDEIAKGGVGMFIRNDVSYSEINLQTIFQAIAFQIFIHIKLTICSIYIHDSINFSERDLENLIEQLPKPFILIGDFNSHNILWFDKKLTNEEKFWKFLF